MSEGQLFEHTVGQGKVKGDTEEELSKAQEEFEKSRIERMVSQDDNEILHASGLYHVYESKSIEGNVVALRGLHVNVMKGEAVAVVGPVDAADHTLGDAHVVSTCWEAHNHDTLLHGWQAVDRSQGLVRSQHGQHDGAICSFGTGLYAKIS